MKLNALPDRKEVIPPEGGWKEHTLYLVWVAFRKSNPVHCAYLEVGFLNTDGSPGNYSAVWCNNYDYAIEFGKVYALRVAQELHIRTGSEL